MGAENLAPGIRECQKSWDRKMKKHEIRRSFEFQPSSAFIFLSQIFLSNSRLLSEEPPLPRTRHRMLEVARFQRRASFIEAELLGEDAKRLRDLFGDRPLAAAA